MNDWKNKLIENKLFCQPIKYVSLRSNEYLTCPRSGFDKL